MDTFYVLSKTIYILGMPITWLVILMIFALFAKGRKKNFIIGLTLILTYTFSTNAIVNRLMNWWEVPGIPYSEIKQPYDVGIVLSGPVKHQKFPKDRIHTDKGADRFLHAADLYSKGLIKHILVTGGHLKPFQKMRSEADKIQVILMQNGVPESAITIEPFAKNTQENAEKSAAILKTQFPDQRYLLITSAFHMRRSLACFKKAKVKVDPFSADFYTSDIRKSSVMSYFPSAKSFNTFSIMVKEMIGYVVYKWVDFA